MCVAEAHIHCWLWLNRHSHHHWDLLSLAAIGLSGTLGGSKLHREVADVTFYDYPDMTEDVYDVAIPNAAASQL